MGDWSTCTTLSTRSSPSTRVCRPGTFRAPLSSRARCVYRMSFTSVDLPEPETPVTAVSTPSGKDTSMSWRLFSRAPCTVSLRLWSAGRRTSGSGISFLPDRYWPVIDSALSSSSFKGPLCTTLPPCSPAPGPMSTTQSATLMVSSSCSTTMSVLPMSRSRTRVSISRWLSRWCRPMDGSSRTYRTPTRPEPIWVARRMRWASPPERVPPRGSATGSRGRRRPGSAAVR